MLVSMVVLASNISQFTAVIRDLSRNMLPRRKLKCFSMILLLRSHTGIPLRSLSIALIDDISYVSKIMTTRLFDNAVS